MTKILAALAKLLLLLLALLLIFTALYYAFCTYKFKTMTDTGIPRLDVYTEGGAKIKSKEEYVNCTVSLSGADEFDFDSFTAGIRGRGNNSWEYYPKKPYRIKFDEKTSVFGESKNKSWVLLAMYNDFSFIKDRLAFTMADSLETDAFVPSYNYVELYLNGKYNGLYLITDQVDENKGRTSVKEDFDADATEVPFLVELDAYAEAEGPEDEAYFRIGEALYTVKYPEVDERYSDAQFEYIKNYVTEFDALCRKKGVTLAELSEYIDVDSFIDFYLVQEAMGQMEINWKSVYMSRAVGEKMKMGPVWDFDWSVTGPHVWHTAKDVKKQSCSGLRSNGNWFDALLKNSPEFRLAVEERWASARGKLLESIDKVESEWINIEQAAKKDWYRWHVLDVYASPKSSHAEVIEWCRGRIAWLDTEFNYKG